MYNIQQIAVPSCSQLYSKPSLFIGLDLSSRARQNIRGSPLCICTFANIKACKVLRHSRNSNFVSNCKPPSGYPTLLSTWPSVHIPLNGPGSFLCSQSYGRQIYSFLIKAKVQDRSLSSVFCPQAKLRQSHFASQALKASLVHNASTEIDSNKTDLHVSRISDLDLHDKSSPGFQAIPWRTQADISNDEIHVWWQVIPKSPESSTSVDLTKTDPIEFNPQAIGRLLSRVLISRVVNSRHAVQQAPSTGQTYADGEIVTSKSSHPDEKASPDVHPYPGSIAGPEYSEVASKLTVGTFLLSPDDIRFERNAHGKPRVVWHPLSLNSRLFTQTQPTGGPLRVLDIDSKLAETQRPAETNRVTAPSPSASSSLPPESLTSCRPRLPTQSSSASAPPSSLSSSASASSSLPSPPKRGTTDTANAVAASTSPSSPVTSTTTLRWPPPPVAHNVTHTDRLAGCAVSLAPRVSLGLDAEAVSRNRPRDVLKLARRRMTPGEVAQLEGLSFSPPAQRLLFTCLWTVKEAVVKALGTGISAPPGLKGFEVLIRPTPTTLHGGCSPLAEEERLAEILMAALAAEVGDGNNNNNSGGGQRKASFGVRKSAGNPENETKALRNENAAIVVHHLSSTNQGDRGTEPRGAWATHSTYPFNLPTQPTQPGKEGTQKQERAAPSVTADTTPFTKTGKESDLDLNLDYGFSEHSFPQILAALRVTVRLGPEARAATTAAVGGQDDSVVSVGARKTSTTPSTGEDGDGDCRLSVSLWQPTRCHVAAVCVLAGALNSPGSAQEDSERRRDLLSWAKAKPPPPTTFRANLASDTKEVVGGKYGVLSDEKMKTFTALPPVSLAIRHWLCRCPVWEKTFLNDFP